MRKRKLVASLCVSAFHMPRHVSVSFTPSVHSVNTDSREFCSAVCGFKCTNHHDHFHHKEETFTRKLILHVVVRAISITAGGVPA